MAEVRKYKGYADERCGGRVVPVAGDSDAPAFFKTEAVSATDDRDVQPLVEAAREARDALGLTSASDALERALQPFEETGEEI